MKNDRIRVPKLNEEDKEMARKTVPAYVQVSGEWIRIGQAVIDEAMGSADVTLDPDLPNHKNIAELFKAPLSDYSIGLNN